MENPTLHRSHMLIVRKIYLGLIVITSVSCVAQKGTTNESNNKVDSSVENELALFQVRKFDKAAKVIEAKLDNGTYSDKDRVKHYLNAGLAYYYAGDTHRTNKLLADAEQAIDENFTKSIAAGTLSFMTNDNALVYDGDLFEDVMINQFKMLSYIKANELDKAQVEARRTSYKLEQIIIKAKGLAELYMKEDNMVARKIKSSDERASFDPADLPIQDMATGHYFSAMIFAKQNKIDNARIELANFKKAYNDISTYFSSTPDIGLLRDSETLLKPDSYNLVLVGYTGRGPQKVEKKADVKIPVFNMDLIFAYPELQYYQSYASRVEVTVNGEKTVRLYELENFSKLSAEVYKVKEPIIYTRAFLRGAVKAYAAKKVSDEAENRLGMAGGLAARMVSRGIQSASESADLRTWDLMPAKVNVAIMKLPPGTHTLEWKFYDQANQLVFLQKKQVEINDSSNLHLDDALYFN